MQKLKSLIPELFLVVATFYYWSLTALVINWFAIAILAILLFLIISQNKITGIVISVLLIVVNLYLILALLSEFNEFPEFNDKAKELLFFGSLFIGVNLLFSSLLFIKYIKKTNLKTDILSNTSDA